MKSFSKFFFLFCLCLSLFSGCKQREAALPLCRVVTQIDIDCQQPDVQIRRHYTDNQKMQYVLIYLRLLKPRSTFSAPAAGKDIYNICIRFSDGSQRIYRQTAHRFLSRDDGPWKAIDPGSAAGLYYLMRQLPSDPDSI